MQLRNARLCLDCEEVHDAAHCPACASESFAFITRWVPLRAQDFAQDHGPKAESPEALEGYRQLLSPPGQPPSPWRFVRRGAVGLAIFGLAGLAWRQRTPRAPR
jgi:hypothetical protein